jgi:hypothetical protein
MYHLNISPIPEDVVQVFVKAERYLFREYMSILLSAMSNELFHLVSA